ncbi:MAG: CHAD domain-containing protein [Solirubrobacteraceae bacterium]
MSTAVKAKIDVPLAYDQRADAGAVAVLRRLLRVIGDNIEGSISGEDPEHLHQLRIAVRRTRTVQRQLARVFPPEELPGYRAEFRWLQQATGDARDLDVYLEDLDSLREMLPGTVRGDLDPLMPILAHRRLSARAEMTRALRSVRSANLFEDWDRLLESLVELPLDDRPAAEQSIGVVAGRRIRKVYKRIVRMGETIDADTPPQAYHDLRKKGKELRYLLELFGVKLFDEEAVTPLVRSLKGLQDVLGRHQDREVQIAMLRSSVDELAGLPGGGAACMAVGTLVERLRADEQAARDEFGAQFADLGSTGQRALVRETFR